MRTIIPHIIQFVEERCAFTFLDLKYLLGRSQKSSHIWRLLGLEGVLSVSNHLAMRTSLQSPRKHPELLCSYIATLYQSPSIATPWHPPRTPERCGLLGCYIIPMLMSSFEQLKKNLFLHLQQRAKCHLPNGQHSEQLPGCFSLWATVLADLSREPWQMLSQRDKGPAAFETRWQDAPLHGVITTRSGTKCESDW